MKTKTDAPPGLLMSTNEVAEFADVTLRQLQWWDERNLLRPLNFGHRRRYSVEQAMVARAVGELRRKEVGSKAIRKAARVLLHSTPAIAGQFLYIIQGSGSLRWGTEAFKVAIAEASEVVPVLEKARTGVYLVEIVEPNLDELARRRHAAQVEKAWHA